MILSVALWRAGWSLQPYPKIRLILAVGSFAACTPSAVGLLDQNGIFWLTTFVTGCSLTNQPTVPHASDNTMNFQFLRNVG